MLDLIDIGANLTHDSFDRDRAEVLARAAAAGVRRAIVTGASVTGSVQALELAAEHPGVLYATAGCAPASRGGLRRAHERGACGTLLANPKVVAVGECGLDYFRDFSPRDAQRHAFQAQLELAAAVASPYSCTSATRMPISSRRSHRSRAISRGGVAHCFTGGPADLEAYLELGLHIGVTGWVCDERRGADLRAAVPSIPLERLLVETDAPYLLPRDLVPKPRAPAQRARVPAARARARGGADAAHARGGGARDDCERGAIVRLELAQFLARAALDGLDRGLHALPMRRERDDQALEVGLVRLRSARRARRAARRPSAGPS